MAMFEQDPWMMEANSGARWVSRHYCSDHSILLVGEGDFSFSLSLATSFGSASNIVATSLDSEGILFKKYSKARSNLENLREMEATIMHGVDVKKMKQHTDLKMRRFDRIVFNFPHAGFKGREDHPNVIKQLVLGFFQNASHMLRPYGEVHVTHKTKQPFIKWNLPELASKCHLVVSELAPFNKEDYPLYNNKRGDGANCDQPFHIGECFTYKFWIFPSAKKQRLGKGTADPIFPATTPHVEHDKTGLFKRSEINQIPITSFPQADVGFGIPVHVMGMTSDGNYVGEMPKGSSHPSLPASSLHDEHGKTGLLKNLDISQILRTLIPQVNMSVGMRVPVLGVRSYGNYVGEVPVRRWDEKYAKKMIALYGLP